VGEGWPLSARRAWFEWEGLTEQHRHAAERVPRPIHYDHALFAFAMSYLTPHIILRRGTLHDAFYYARTHAYAHASYRWRVVCESGVVEGREYPHAAEHLGEFLARTLYATSVYKRRSSGQEVDRWHRQIEFFNQNHMHKITGTPPAISTHSCPAQLIKMHAWPLAEELFFVDPFTVSQRNRWNSPHLDSVARV
jgi:5-methylthioribose kinase